MELSMSNWTEYIDAINFSTDFIRYFSFLILALAQKKNNLLSMLADVYYIFIHLMYVLWKIRYKSFGVLDLLIYEV
jgi:hypothetical protein